MAEITIRYLQRVLGNRPGVEATVEHTDFVDALIAQNRVEVVVAEHAPRGHEGPIVGVFVDSAPVEPQVSEYEAPAEGTNDLGQVLSFEAEVEQAVASTPKPGAPRRPRG